MSANERLLPRLLIYCPVQVTALPLEAQGDDAPGFQSNLLGVSDDRTELQFELPMPPTDAARQLRVGWAMRLAMGDGMALWTFESTITRLVPNTPDGLWTRRPLDPGAYSQSSQRQILRVSLVRRVVLSVPQESGNFAMRGETANIGGGGLAVRTDEVLPMATLLRVRIELHPGQLPLQCEATVIDSRPLEDGRHESRLAFATIDEPTQSALLQVCFQEQLARRRNDLTL